MHPKQSKTSESSIIRKQTICWEKMGKLSEETTHQRRYTDATKNTIDAPPHSLLRNIHLKIRNHYTPIRVTKTTIFKHQYQGLK